MSAAPGVLNLACETAILAFHRASEPFERVGIVLPPNLYTGHTRLMPHHAKRLSHTKRYSSRRPVSMIKNFSVRHAAFRRRKSGYRCVRDSITESLPRQTERSEQRGEVAVVGFVPHGLDILILYQLIRGHKALPFACKLMRVCAPG